MKATSHRLWIWRQANTHTLSTHRPISPATPRTPARQIRLPPPLASPNCWMPRCHYPHRWVHRPVRAYVPSHIRLPGGPRGGAPVQPALKLSVRDCPAYETRTMLGNWHSVIGITHTEEKRHPRWDTTQTSTPSRADRATETTELVSRRDLMVARHLSRHSWDAPDHRPISPATPRTPGPPFRLPRPPA